MAETAAREGRTRRVPGIIFRTIAAAVSIVTYIVFADQLEPAALVAARFGVGLVLLALLVDVGRAFAGASPPLPRRFTLHEQRADPQVDETYRGVHREVRRFIDDADWSTAYEEVMRGALASRGVAESDARDALDAARRSAEDTPNIGRPVLLALVSGAVLVLGVALTTLVLFEALGAPVAGPLLVVIGVGVWMLQVRGIGAGNRALTLAVGLPGALLLFLGGRAMPPDIPALESICLWSSMMLAAATVGLAFFYPFRRASWVDTRGKLQGEMVAMRRAFVVTFIAGLVLFPFEPLLAALFKALAISFDTPYRMAAITWITLATFLALELAGTWYALFQGERRARIFRQRRVDANDRLLKLLEGRLASPILRGRIA